MLTVTTELDAVNLMLSAIGSDPVNSLVDSTDVDVINCRRLLEKCSRDVQRQGWDFNKGTYTLYPNQYDKRIVWDDTIIYHKSTDSNTYVKRGDYLYDITNQTYEFDDKIKLEVIIAVDFGDLPECFRNYITSRAAVMFQVRYLGDSNTSQFLQMEMAEAYQDIVDYDLKMDDVNMLRLTNIANVLVRT